jgi:hypothetical protein
LDDRTGDRHARAIDHDACHLGRRLHRHTYRHCVGADFDAD